MAPLLVSHPYSHLWRLSAAVVRLALAVMILTYLLRKIPFSQVLDAITLAHPLLLVVALVVTLGSLLAVTVRLKWLADAHGLGFSTFELFQINLATRFYGLFLPAGNFLGIFIRFYKVSNPQKSYAGTIVALFSDRMAATVALCFVGVAFWLLAFPFESWPILVLMLMVLAALLIVQAVLSMERPLRTPFGLRYRFDRRFPKRLETVRQAMRQSRTLPGRVRVYIHVLSLLAQLLGIVAYGLVAASLGVDVSFVTIAWTRSAAMLVAMIPVSIAGLGVREATLIMLLAPYGIAAADALAFSLLVFAATILAVALLGGLVEAKRLLF